MTTFVFLHGWQGSEPEHWQRLTAAALERRGHTVRFPDFPDPDRPRLAPWLALLESELHAVEPAETTVLAHSLGCHLWLHHGVAAVTPVDRVLLVAPPGPDVCARVEELRELGGTVPHPDAAARAARSTALVYADDDPYWPDGDAGALGTTLDVPSHRIADGGHLNVASGYGEWPELLAWCEGAGGF